MASTIEILITAQNQATAEIRTLQNQLRALNDQVNRNVPATNNAAAANARLAASFRAASQAGGILTTTLVALGGIALFVDAVRTIGEFEQALAGVEAVIGATDTQLEELEETARDLGATTIFSATQAAEGLEFLGRAGFTANEALGAIEGTLNLAAAGSLDLANAADITSNVISGFNLAASEATRVADVLAFGAANANTNVAQLGEAFSLVAPVAAAFNQSVDETAGALGILGNAGIQASSAGTGLRAVLAALASETPKLSGVLTRLGLTYNDVNPATQSLEEIVSTLAETSLNATDAFEVFGRRGAPAILALTSQAEDFRELNEGIRGSQGAAEEIADTLSDTLFGALRELRSAFEELLLQVGDSGLGASLRELVETVTGVVRVFSNSLDPLDENAALYRQIAAAVESLGLVLASLVATRVVGFLGTAATGLNGLLISARAATAGVTGLRAAVIGLRTVILGALGPIGWIIGLGLAFASFADNEAEQTADALREIEESLIAVRNEAEGFSLDQLERETSRAEQEIADLNTQLLETQGAIDAATSAAGNVGFDAFDETGGFVEQANAEALELQAQGIEARIAQLEGENEARREILERRRQEELDAERRRQEELLRLQQAARTAEVDAINARQNLEEARALQELELAASTADEIAAIRTAELEQQLEQQTISVEEYYAGLERLALEQLDREIAIEQQKLNAQRTLQQQALANLAAEQQQAETGAAGEEELAAITARFQFRRQALEAAQAEENLAIEANLREFGLRRQQIIAENDTAELEAINRRNEEERQAEIDAREQRLEDFEAAFDAEIAEINRQAALRQQALDRQQAAGEVTGFQFDAAQVQIARDQAAALQDVTQEFAELNEQVGSQVVSQNIEQIEQDIIDLNATVGPELDKLNKSIDENLAKSFESVIDGTQSVEDAFRSLIANVAQELASSALRNAISGFGASLTSALGGVGGAGGGAGIGGIFASLFAAKGGYVKAAEGGYITGKGTATSDSIPARLSNGEYVMQASAVKHYGLNLMEAINRMALAKQSGIRNFAVTRPRRARFQEGGFVDDTGSQTAASQAPAQSSLRLVNVVDTNEASNYLSSSDGESMIVNIIRRNGSQIKSLLR